MLRTFRIITLGCKVNQSESAMMAGVLIRDGWSEQTDAKCPADLIVVNTCTVTNKSDYQSRQAIRRLVRDNPGAQVLVTGCYSQINSNDVSTLDGISSIIPIDRKHLITNYIKPLDIEESIRSSSQSHLDLHANFAMHSDRARAFLKIQDGCNNRCTYCAVWMARGKSRSHPVEAIIQSVKRLEQSGIAEIVLTGIHIGHWGLDLGSDHRLVRLLCLLLKETTSIRFRISSIEVNEIGSDLIHLVANEERICRHLHIPLQSGCTAILERMNRSYSADRYFEVLETIATQIPRCCLGSDVICGFPGETDLQFKETRTRISTSPLSYLHVFPFSPKRGTSAALMTERTSPSVTKSRCADLRALSAKLRTQFIAENIGHVLQVTCEHIGNNSPSIKIISDNYIHYEIDISVHCVHRQVRTLFTEDNARSAMNLMNEPA